jgi:hypothetical protein
LEVRPAFHRQRRQLAQALLEGCHRPLEFLLAGLQLLRLRSQFGGGMGDEG